MRYWNHSYKTFRVLYPFPLADGRVASLDLPDEPVTAEDAERLASFLAALATPAEEPAP